MVVKITEDVLRKVKGFKEDPTGYFSDGKRFSLKKGDGIDENWVLYLFDKTDDGLIFLKELSTLGDLMNVYKAITNKTLLVDITPENESHIFFQ